MSKIHYLDENIYSRDYIRKDRDIDIDIIKLLLCHKDIDLNKKNKDQQTAFMIAQQIKDPALRQVIVQLFNQITMKK